MESWRGGKRRLVAAAPPIISVQCIYRGENGVFGAVGRVQAGGGDMGHGGRGDCCSMRYLVKLY